MCALVCSGRNYKQCSRRNYKQCSGRRGRSAQWATEINRGPELLPRSAYASSTVLGFLQQENRRLVMKEISPCVPLGPAARGLHSSTFQLNLSRFRHKTHPGHPLMNPNTPYTPP